MILRLLLYSSTMTFMLVFPIQVARKLVILEGELERAEERAEISEL